MKPSLGSRVLLLCAGVLIAGLPAAAPAEAKLDAKAWKAAKTEFEKLFAGRGDGDEDHGERSC